MCENPESSSAWSIKGLGAIGPDPDLKDGLKLFGQFVGDWTIAKARYLKSDGKWAVFRGEVHFGWILGGNCSAGRLDRLSRRLRENGFVWNYCTIL